MAGVLTLAIAVILIIWPRLLAWPIGAFAFWLAGALLAVTTRHIVHAALWLVVALGSLAGVYLVLGAEIVALVQLLVYVGAMPRVDSAPADTTVAAFQAGNNKSKLAVRGIAITGKRAFGVQYHPEASPGPQDSFYLFEKFVGMLG